MSTTTDPPDDDPDVKFRAQICWLGPIMGAPEENEETGKVKIAGAEDPALGKSFAVALLPVEEIDGYFRETQPNKEREVVARLSDSHGWFALDAPTALWLEPAEGVLVVLLYNESKDLAYYTYNDYKPTHKPVTRAQFGATAAFLSTERILDPMPQSVRDKIEDKIGEAIGELLKSKAKDLRKGLAELRPTPAPASAADAELVFAVASCQYPSAMLEDAVAGASYGRLADWVSGKKYRRPQFLLLVGDQIYVDGTAGLFDPTSQFDRFVRPYEILYRMNPVRDVLRRLPAYMMMDDHEIRDNWEPRVDDTRPDREMLEGRRSYMKFQRRAGPPKVDPVGDSNDPIWFDIRRGSFGVFMADTRTERTVRTARRVAPARIMTETQMTTLLAWLSAQPADAPKVVATPSILLPRHARALQRAKGVSVLRSDGWDGYPHSLRQVLTHIAREKIRNVVFVSGDEHLACTARVVLDAGDGDPVVFHSVHSSPLFAPFPFANSVREDLVAHEEFEFLPKRDRDDGAGDDPDGNHDGGKVEEHGGGRRFRCRVDTEFAAPGDGFAVIRFYLEGGAWMMQCDFDRAGMPEGASRMVRALS